MSKTQPARGTRDFLPADVRKRNYVINIIREVYESYGFEPLETPSIENLETLTGKYGEEGGQLMFKILKRGEKLQEEITEGKIKSENELSDLALRYDLTVPLARVVANYKNELPKFFKRYQIQPVWRADRPAKGRYREFYQCDVDAIGSKSMMVEAELCAAVSEILQKLGFDNFTIRINHREVLGGMLEVAGIPSEKHIDALIALDKLDKIGREGVEKEFKEREIFHTEEGLILFRELIEVMMIGIFEMQKSITALELGHLSKSEIENISNNTLERITNFLRENEKGQNGIKDIRKIFSFVDGRLGFDPSLARGLSYYTGAIFEINVPDLAGSLGGGGRYDGLIGMFGKEQIPACGFSLGLERILVVMEERGMFPPELETNAADVMVTVWNEETAGESLKLANELRKAGRRVLVYPEVDKLGKQFKYADAIGVNYVCVVGETEIAENTVTLKNMRSGEQETISRVDIGGKLRDLFKNPANVAL